MNAASGGEEVSSESHVIIGKDIVVGSRILNISDIFASLLEDRPNRPALNCIEAVYELTGLVRSESGYLPLAETMQDYIDDIEGRVQTAKAEIDKRYRSIMDTCAKLLGR
jgi:response regulator RpfG family c-di-GMP phosphodiesterase